MKIILVLIEMLRIKKTSFYSFFALSQAEEGLRESVALVEKLRSANMVNKQKNSVKVKLEAWKDFEWIVIGMYIPRYDKMFFAINGGCLNY